MEVSLEPRSALLQAVMDKLEYYHDIPIPYGRNYGADLAERARQMILLIDVMRAMEKRGEP